MCDVTILLSTFERHGHIPATIKCEVAAQNNIAIDAICFIVNVDELQCPRLRMECWESAFTLAHRNRHYNSVQQRKELVRLLRILHLACLTEYDNPVRYFANGV